jgi:hypothetical protein
MVKRIPEEEMYSAISVLYLSRNRMHDVLNLRFMLVGQFDLQQ